jgi:hypothetical protein
MLDKTDDVSVAARDWLAAFEAALASADGVLEHLFCAESYWRDVLALSWNIQTLNGAAAIVKQLRPLAADPGCERRRPAESLDLAHRARGAERL